VDSRKLLAGCPYGRIRLLYAAAGARPITARTYSVERDGLAGCDDGWEPSALRGNPLPFPIADDRARNGGRVLDGQQLRLSWLGFL